jgi:hypothetical protein
MRAGLAWPASREAQPHGAVHSMIVPFIGLAVPIWRQLDPPQRQASVGSAKSARIRDGSLHARCDRPSARSNQRCLVGRLHARIAAGATRRSIRHAGRTCVDDRRGRFGGCKAQCAGPRVQGGIDASVSFAGCRRSIGEPSAPHRSAAAGLVVRGDCTRPTRVASSGAGTGHPARTVALSRPPPPDDRSYESCRRVRTVRQSSEVTRPKGLGVPGPRAPQRAAAASPGARIRRAST